MSDDFDLGSGSVEIKTIRNISRVDLTRDRETKIESMNGFIKEEKWEVVNSVPTTLISEKTYVVQLTHDALINLPGHNPFLGGLKNIINQSLNEYIVSGSINSITGSVSRIQ